MPAITLDPTAMRHERYRRLSDTAEGCAIGPCVEDELRQMERVAAADALAALKPLVRWMRQHTGPHDENSPHDILCAACYTLQSYDPEYPRAGE